MAAPPGRIERQGRWLLFTLLLATPAAAQNALTNPGMEQGAPGGLPAGWVRGGSLTGDTAAAYTVALVDSGAHLGRRAARIASRQAPGPEDRSGISQSLDATAYRGKSVWLRAFAHVALVPGFRRAVLWIRVERPGGVTDLQQGSPIFTSDWRPSEVVMKVAPDAERILVGLELGGAGEAWLDDATLRIVPPAAPAELSRPLSRRGLANEVAFARLLGYVRFFHPSDEALLTDWNGFAVRGVRAVEGAADARRLAVLLDSLFRPIAPSLVVSAGAPRARSAAAPPPAGAHVVMWRHQGVGIGSRMPLYSSTRIRAPAPAGVVPDSFASPTAPLALDLGGGVRASIPLALYADSLGTLPRGGPAPSDDERPAAMYSADDRAVRLADVALAWTVFQHFYPYFDVVGGDWPAELPRALAAAAIDSDAWAFFGTLRRLGAALHDGHGWVVFPHDRHWLPPVRPIAAEGRVVVLAVAPGEKRLRPGDAIVAIDHKPVERLLAEAERLAPGATPGRVHLWAVYSLLEGPKESELLLDVLHADGSPESVPVRRTTRQGDVRDPRPDAIAELRPGTWYVDPSRLTSAMLAQAMPRLAAARGLVFDARGTWLPQDAAMPEFGFMPHLSRAPLKAPRMQIPLITRPDRRDISYPDEPGGEWPAEEPFFAGRCAFLIDPGAISMFETYLSLIEPMHRCDFVGEPTAGTNGNANPFDLPGGYTMYWTGMRVLKADGSRFHGVGIHPTVPVVRTIAGIATGKDEQLERAIQVVEEH